MAARSPARIAQEPAIFVKPDGQVRNPANNKIMQPRGLDGPELTISEDEDPAQKPGRLDGWPRTNPFFARAFVNRMWAHFMSRGLVEQVDDMRVTNPPSNGPSCSTRLAKDLIASTSST